MMIDPPTSADISSAIAALDQIASAVRLTGQAGVAFRDLDLAHPELSEIAADLIRVQQQFATIAQLRQSPTAAVLRRFGDVLDWHSGVHWQIVDPAGIQRHRETVVPHLVRGTRWDKGDGKTWHSVGAPVMIAPDGCRRPPVRKADHDPAAAIMRIAASPPEFSAPRPADHKPSLAAEPFTVAPWQEESLAITPIYDPIPWGLPFP